MKTVEQRLDELEKNVRLWRRVTAVLAVLLVAVVTMGQTRSGIEDVVRCRKLQVYNSEDKVTAIIQNLNDTGSLAVCNREGMPAVFVNAGEFGGSVAVKDNEFFTTTSLSSRENGGTLRVSNKTREEVVVLYVDEYGNGVVGAYNRKGFGRTLKPGP